MKRTFVVAEMSLREIARRRAVLAIIALLPLAFYLSRRGDHLGQSIRFVCLGVGWALSTAALFAGGAARAVEPRLRLSGYRGRHLTAGRLIALWSLGIVLSAPYFLLVRLDQHDVRYGAIALIFLLTVAVGAPFGLALAAVLPRELEGTLVLITIVGLQMMLDPAGAVAHALPFWSSRELGTYAVDHTDAGYLDRGLLHGVCSAVLLTVLVGTASGIRLRRRPHLTVILDTD